MYYDINKYHFIFIGWLIRISYQLNCLQCTSPIRRLSESWDHSCLDGTLIALPCHEPNNASERAYKHCVSSLYRGGQRGIAGVLIHRGCKNGHVVPHDCDPPASLIDFNKAENFYCSQTCSDNGCNRHSVEEIKSKTNKLLKNKFILLLYLLCIFIFGCNLYSG